MKWSTCFIEAWSPQATCLFNSKGGMPHWRGNAGNPMFMRSTHHDLPVFMFCRENWQWTIFWELKDCLGTKDWSLLFADGETEAQGCNQGCIARTTTQVLWLSGEVLSTIWPYLSLFIIPSWQWPWHCRRPWGTSWIIGENHNLFLLLSVYHKFHCI